MIKMPKKIMIIEDNEMLSDMYNFKLSLEWYEVLVENDSTTAITKYEKFNPDLILLDLMMPKVSWFDILKKIKWEMKSEVKIIVLSNISWKEYEKKVLDLWADKFILKSNLSPKDLLPIIKEIL